MTGGGKSDDAILTVGSVPSLGLQYARLMRDLKTQEAIYEQLTKQYELAKVAEAKDSSSLQLLDEAVVPIKKSKPKRSLIVLLTTACAFFCSVIFAFLQEYFEKVDDEDKLRWQEIKYAFLHWR
jgi:uncharacterized protein involved in exopolysaccharide biosynthesis